MLSMLADRRQMALSRPGSEQRAPATVPEGAARAAAAPAMG